jgi:hypothetical protein
MLKKFLKVLIFTILCNIHLIILGIGCMLICFFFYYLGIIVFIINIVDFVLSIVILILEFIENWKDCDDIRWMKSYKRFIG